jgi:glyoxalase superfamily protein
MPATFHAIPILRIFDVPRAGEFYVGFLGFQGLRFKPIEPAPH